jgi:hypothetical protein
VSKHNRTRLHSLKPQWLPCFCIQRISLKLQDFARSVSICGKRQSPRQNCCLKGNNDLSGTSIAKNPFDEMAAGKLIRFAGGRVMSDSPDDAV